ncbi:MAG TPA: Uma2 family endonuclease [Bryobacteraceae bacterium]|nr:Uma2 family endonuclease [Bryobacteraceae bacterium]
MATTSKLLTYEEWLKLPEAEGIEEVVNGEIQKMPPNKWNHARIVEMLAHLLRAQLDPEAVYVVTSVFGLIIRREPLTTRVPDLAVFTVAELVERDGYVVSAPDLIVEVLSAGNTRAERIGKLKDYESLGVPEVWVLSPEAQTVEALQFADRRLVTTAVLKEGGLAPLHFPDAAIDIAAIWPK